MKNMIFLFPGQGAQYVGMGKELAEEFAIARQTFEEANEALGFDLQKLCFEGDIEELTKQPIHNLLSLHIVLLLFGSGWRSWV